MATSQTFEVDVGGKTYEVDAPDPNTAWAWANQHHTATTERMAKATAADQQRIRDEFDSEQAALPWGTRAMQNLGAGFHTLGQGIQQVGAKMGIGSGVGDEELKESRAMKEKLAESTAGGGALQLTGEVAPTLVIPGGLAMQAARRLPGALAASAAANFPRALSVAENAVLGAGTGALMPVLSDESRLANAGLGAAGGAAGTMAGQFAAKNIRLLTKSGREGAKAERIGKGINRALDEAGESPAEVYGALQARRVSPVTRDVPLTAAEKSGSLGLARAELAHRSRAPEIYGQHQRSQAEGLWNAAQNAGREGTEEAGALAAKQRAMATDPMRDEAMKLAGRWSHVGEPLQKNVDDLLKDAAVGSAEHRLAKLVQDNLDVNPNPKQLYALRKLLTTKLSGPSMPGDDIAAAVKGAQRETMRMVKAIDDRLDEAADNTWSPYLMEYADRSKPVTSSRAQQQITEKLGTAPEVGNVPEVTGKRLADAIRQYGTNKQGFERLTPEAVGRYGDVKNVLRQIEEPMRTLKKAGTGGGGAQIAMQRNIAEKVLMLIARGKVPLLGRIVDAVGQHLEEPARRELAELLIDPQATAKAIRAALTSGAPLSAGQRGFLAVANAAGTGSALALSPTQ